jgi:hypothetical protein
MKRHATATLAALAFLLVAGVAPAMAQVGYKIPFPFQTAGRKLPAGDYTILETAEGTLTLRQATTGKELPVPFTERLVQPTPALAEPQLVFDEVGDFAPSYTEYVTVYILSEVWFLREDGFRTHTTKGAHKTKAVKAAGTK